MREFLKYGYKVLVSLLAGVLDVHLVCLLGGGLARAESEHLSEGAQLSLVRQEDGEEEVLERVDGSISGLTILLPCNCQQRLEVGGRAHGVSLN